MMMKPIKNRFFQAGLAALLILALAGCGGVGPDYVRPDVEMPENWKGRPDSKTMTEAEQEALASWWSVFNDPVLNQLIQRAIAGNLDVKKAAAQVREARLQRTTASADLWPKISASGQSSTTRSQNQSGAWQNQESYSLGLDVSWEIDLFGGTRREIEAAEAEHQAAIEDLRDVLVSLTAETATAYVQLRMYQERLALAKENIRLQEQAADLARIQYQTGMTGSLDLDQATYSLESTRSQVPELEAGIQETKNRLAVLLGGWPGDLDRELAKAGSIPKADVKTAIGIPADLLRRRPDIRATERRLAAQTANVGAAKADLYPKLTLSGSLGWDALALAGLISPANLAAVVAAGLSYTVFNAGSLRANVEIQNVKQEEALIDYESSLRTAVEEVENALTDLATESRKQDSLTKAARAAQSAAHLALQKYQAGLSDFQDVLETQKSLTSFEDSLAQSRGQSALDLIVMYKALGGGWTETEKAPAAK